jgi:thiosulfate dehydrogenase [quinone] large subunit
LTFVYAGLQKISDPGFLQPGARTYIGTQLQSFAAHSPIGFAIDWFALPEPKLAGIAVIVAELVIGVLVLLGIATRRAAAAGALLSFVFFLTASWTVQPYFLGSDSIYTVAWITLLMVGDQGVLVARSLFFREPAAGTGRPLVDPARRRLLLQLGAGGIAFVWVLALLPRSRAFTGAVRQSATPSPTPGSTTSPTTAPSSTGTRLGSVADLQSRGSITFRDPATGDPSLAVQLSGGSVVAFDAVCTHADCQVNYDSGQRLFVCPCHGAEFDPARAAAVVAGPAPTPLPAIKVHVASDGGIYAG